jgi:hypothetical protein
VGPIRIAGDVIGARIQVAGAVDGKIAVIDIGGRLAAHPTDPNSGLIDATGSIGRVIVDGNIEGGGGATSGIVAGRNIGPVTIGGSLLGGGGTESGRIVALRGNIGPIRIAGDIRSGNGNGSGSIKALGEYDYPSARLVGGKISTVLVGGDVIGTATDGASIFATKSIGTVKVKSLNGAADDSASIQTFLSGIGPVTVAGDVAGGAGNRSAAIISAKGIGAVTVGGSVGGSSGQDSASLQAKAGSIGRVRISGDVTGGPGAGSASIQAFAKYIQVNPNKVLLIGGKTASIGIDGTLIGGSGVNSARVGGENGMGPVKVKAITGGDGAFSAAVVSGNAIASVTVIESLVGGDGGDSASIQAASTIGPVKIGGDVRGGNGSNSAAIDGSRIVSASVGQAVVGGVGVGSATIIADKSIGRVDVGASWGAASIAAGIRAGADGYLGTADDIIIPGGVITKITIGGLVDGSALAGDRFAFTAGRIKSANINGLALSLSPSSVDSIDLGGNADFQLVEK